MGENYKLSATQQKKKKRASFTKEESKSFVSGLSDTFYLAELAAALRTTHLQQKKKVLKGFFLFTFTLISLYFQSPRV